MPYLSKRLQSIVDEIGTVETLADIGTDHGKLVMYALGRGSAERAFAVDISPNSLIKAKRCAEEKGLSQKIEFLCGDGLKPLDEVPDVVVIAGMGGNEIVKILSERIIDTKFILVPHQDAHVVRRFLCENEFAIVKDFVIFDGKYYTIIVAQKGQCRYTEQQIILGGNNPPSGEYTRRLLERKTRIENIMSSQNVTEDKLQSELAIEYKEIQKWLQSKTQ